VAERLSLKDYQRGLAERLREAGAGRMASKLGMQLGTETWLVDLNSATLFVYRRPSPEGYQDVRAYRRGESVSPAAFPDVSFTVEEILG